MEKYVSYGARALAIKEKDFTGKELVDQLWAGHVVTFSLERVRHLKGLCISSLAVILKTGCKPRLIYDFSWKNLNEKSNQEDPKEDNIRFGRDLHRILDCILKAASKLGPYLLKKGTWQMHTCVSGSGFMKFAPWISSPQSKISRNKI